MGIRLSTGTTVRRRTSYRFMMDSSRVVIRYQWVAHGSLPNLCSVGTYSTSDVFRSQNLLVIFGHFPLTLPPSIFSSALLSSTLLFSSLSYRFHQSSFQTLPKWRQTRKPSLHQNGYRTGASSSIKHVLRLPLRPTDMTVPERPPIPLLSAGFQTTLEIPWSLGPRRSGS